MKKITIDVKRCNEIRYKNLEYKGSLKSFTPFFREAGLHCSNAYLSYYVKYGMIVKNEDGTYSFSKKPWFLATLQDVTREISATNIARVKKSHKSIELTEESAIYFLKSRGFEIRKLIPEHYETY